MRTASSVCIIQPIVLPCPLLVLALRLFLPCRAVLQRKASWLRSSDPSISTMARHCWKLSGQFRVVSLPELPVICFQLLTETVCRTIILSPMESNLSKKSCIVESCIRQCLSVHPTVLSTPPRDESVPISHNESLILCIRAPDLNAFRTGQDGKET